MTALDSDEDDHDNLQPIAQADDSCSAVQAAVDGDALLNTQPVGANEEKSAVGSERMPVP